MRNCSITAATCITCIRIFCVPFILVSIRLHQWGYALLLLGAAALTDALDGSIARWRNEQTFFGACLDPLADKFLLLSCFGALASVQGLSETIPLWFFWLLFVKELLLVVPVVGMYIWHGVVTIRPSKLGKMTTCVQLLLVMLVITSYFFNKRLGYAYQGLLLGTVSMTVGSYLQYIGSWYKHTYYSQN